MYLPCGSEHQERALDWDRSPDRPMARADSGSRNLPSAGTVSDDVNNGQSGLSHAVVGDVQFKWLGSQRELECPRLYDRRI